MMRQLFANRFFAQADVVEVRVVVLDISKPSGKGMDGIEVTLDGRTKLTEAGIVSFYNVTQGEHTYMVATPPGCTFVDGEAPFSTPLGRSGLTNITWKPVPDTSWPSSQPWLMMFHFTTEGVDNGNGDENGVKKFSILGLRDWPYVSQFLEKYMPNAPYLSQLPPRGTGLILGTARRNRGYGTPLTDVERTIRHPG